MDTMPTTILIIDDEVSVAKFLHASLQRVGFDTYMALSGTEALADFEQIQPDLVILDLTLPDIDGLEICRFIRTQKRYVPIIMLTGRDEDTDRVVGLEIGADDYVTKPFSIKELVARVRAVLRLVKSFRLNPPQDRLSFGELEIDLKGRSVLLGGQLVHLTPKEFELLVILARAPGRAFQRETLMERVWGYEFEGSSRTVDIHVQRLRRKLGDDSRSPRYIHTVHGVGYKFQENAE